MEPKSKTLAKREASKSSPAFFLFSIGINSLYLG